MSSWSIHKKPGHSRFMQFILRTIVDFRPNIVRATNWPQRERASQRGVQRSYLNGRQAESSMAYRTLHRGNERVACPPARARSPNCRICKMQKAFGVRLSSGRAVNSDSAHVPCQLHRSSGTICRRRLLTPSRSGK